MFKQNPTIHNKIRQGTLFPSNQLGIAITVQLKFWSVEGNPPNRPKHFSAKRLKLCPTWLIYKRILKWKLWQATGTAAHIDEPSGVTRYANEPLSHSQLKIHFSIQQQPARKPFLSHSDISQLKIQLLIQLPSASITLVTLCSAIMCFIICWW